MEIKQFVVSRNTFKNLFSSKKILEVEVNVSSEKVLLKLKKIEVKEELHDLKTSSLYNCRYEGHDIVIVQDIVTKLKYEGFMVVVGDTKKDLTYTSNYSYFILI